MEEEKEGKKEIQYTITVNEDYKKVSDDEFLEILKMISPGTIFRAGIDGALKTGKGALIVMEKENIYPLIDGGFKVNCRFTPQRLIELTKMDGAIVLSKDGKKILWANVLLTPESKINTSETGTRHKAAERTARQIGTLTIAISERRSEITLFYKTIRYPLKSTSEVLRKAVWGMLPKNKLRSDQITRLKVE